ncbi:MAG TPA: M56 family metallopeptidase [Gammaproteobacteria bacterium]|nr:M56 family metallopeptidase [Gammaproteobacteria bacterium]
MNSIAAIIDSPFFQALGWALIHFIWQGACAGAIYAILRHALRSSSPAARYRLAMLTLAAMAMMPVVTLLHLLTGSAVSAASTSPLPAANMSLAPAVVSAGSQSDWIATAVSLLHDAAPWVVPFWVFGVMVMSLRVWRGWQQTRVLRRTAVFSSLPAWQAAVDRLKSVLGINKAIQLAVSAAINVPSVIGWLKPVILIPPGVLTGLTPAQMELILAHELAHIRRQDYFWNLLQVIVDTLLFYHPVVRWISQHARIEREQCCDDIVVNLNGDAINYARALTELECLRAPQNAIIMGAGGGHVIDRIDRLIGLPAAEIPPYSWLLPVVALGLLITGSFARPAYKATSLPALVEQHIPGSSHASESVNRRTATPEHLKLQPTDVAIANLNPTGLTKIGAPAPVEPVSSMPRLAAPGAPPLAPLMAPTRAPAPQRSGGEILERQTPHYPQFALERGISGSATVSFTLTADGEITNIKVAHVQGSHLFGQAAVNALKNWKFTPVMINGKPVDQTLTQEFDFRLNSPDDKTGTCRIPIGFHVCSRN